MGPQQHRETNSIVALPHGREPTGEAPKPGNCVPDVLCSTRQRTSPPIPGGTTGVPALHLRAPTFSSRPLDQARILPPSFTIAAAGRAI